MRKPFKGDYPVTQTFGNDLVINGVHIYGQYGYKGHNGIDYGLPLYTSILAPHNGKVIEAAYDANGYGWYVKIENPIEGSVLGHFSSLSIIVGQEIVEGQVLGQSGNTGNSTGPHLHHGYYRMPRNRQNGYGGFIDQTPYMVTVTLPEPNPGYAPTFEGMTVEKDGKTYKSYKKDGVLLWKIETPNSQPNNDIPTTCIPTREYDAMRARISDVERANTRLTEQLALKDVECLEKLINQKDDIINKIINLTSAL